MSGFGGGVRSPFAIVTRPGATRGDVVGVCQVMEVQFAGAKGIWMERMLMTSSNHPMSHTPPLPAKRTEELEPSLSHN